MSRFHCQIKRVNGDWFIEDTGSHYGTWLNGHPVTRETRVSAGDVVTVAGQDLLFR